jgi:hypothetical protein
MTQEDLDNKFEALSGDKLDKSRRVAVKELIFNCDNLSAVDFMDKLVV